MSSNLPTRVVQAGTMLGEALAINDAEARRMIIAWGRQQILEEYPEDPVRAPLNGLRRWRALREWDTVIRTNGRELRGVVAGAAVAELKFQLQRRQQQILAEDAEVMRQRATVFDAELNLRLTSELADRDLARQKDLSTHQFDLAQRGDDAASRQRMEEATKQAELDIHRLLTEAVIKASGTSSAEETIKATRLVNEEITPIRHDPSLSPDEQHVQIKNLLDTMPGDAA